MRPTERLATRLATELSIELAPGSTFRRTYAGRVQRQGGAWSWFVLAPDGVTEVCGSPFPVSDLLRAPALLSHVTYGCPPEILPTVVDAATAD